VTIRAKRKQKFECIAKFYLLSASIKFADRLDTILSVEPSLLVKSFN